MTDLSGIVKAYDVRGIVPDQLDERVAKRAAEFTAPTAPETPTA